MIKLVIPGEPMGKGRHRTTRTGHTYTPEKTATYENLVKVMYMQQCGKQKMSGAMRADITAYFKIPKSASKKRKQEMLVGRIRPTKKPDWDNIAKIICDPLNEIAYKDDSYIVSGSVDKYYSDDPRVEVEIRELEQKIS